MPAKFAGAEWLERAYKVKFSPLGCLVAEILGQVYRGIYHLDHGSTLTKPKWDNERYIQVSISRELATYDGSELTELVIAAHEHAIRFDVRPNGPGHLKLGFSPREHGAADVFNRHPTIEEAVEYWRENLALDGPTAGKGASSG